MNDLQKCQLEILKDFVRVCDENHLQYYLIGGTCLGAARHHGFIPWDDDIDVALPRPDFDKLMQLQSSFKKEYFLQTFKTDPKFIYNYIKIRDSRTTFIENFYWSVNMNHGVWIDVFPLDGLSYKYKDPKKLSWKTNMLWFDVYMMYPICLWRKVHLKTFWKDIPCNFLSILFFLSNVGHWRNKLIERRNRRIPYDKAVQVGNICGTNPKKEAMPKEIFGEGTFLDFEGVSVKVPKDYDKYLTLLYHDYMKLPPLDKQEGHHHDRGLSLTQSYIDYRKEHKM